MGLEEHVVFRLHTGHDYGFDEVTNKATLKRAFGNRSVWAFLAKVASPEAHLR